MSDAPLPLDTGGPLSACLGAFRTQSPPFAAQLAYLASLADTDLSVLILGDSGTGKEHLAREIHRASRRALAPFIAINCAALAPSLIESELFGHVKGAFTGSTDRDGAIVAAAGGTLFLDEIGDAPLQVQNALLRVLDVHQVRPVGSDRERRVDVRVMAATSRPLPTLIQQQRFRSDLYFRLAEVSITLPTLHARCIDLPQLSKAILAELACTKPLSPSALALLQRHPWPGNVRELRNALRRAVCLARDATLIDACHFADLVSLTPAIEAVSPSSCRVEFPTEVQALADGSWQAGTLPGLHHVSRYEKRAWYRALLLALSVNHEPARFPPRLVAAWSNLFRSRWHQSEGGRGLKDLLRVLGFTLTNERAVRWVLRAARGTG